ncbi:MAG: CocE/NonD family hydrolase [Polyangiales bacterium]
MTRRLIDALDLTLKLALCAAWASGCDVSETIREADDANASNSEGSETGGKLDAGPARPLDAATTKPPVDTPTDAGSASDTDVRCQADPRVPQQTDYGRAGPHQVGTLELTLEDSSRPIVATDKHAAAPSRRLVTTIYYPASGLALFGAAPLAKGGPFPLLMYSHGYSSSRNEGNLVAKRAASHGYVVVAPDFPLTNLGANGGKPDIDDGANQPGDVSFLIDRVLAFSADTKHALAGAVDPARIGALGVSLGGFTTLLVSLHPELHDPRIKVAMPIAAVSSFFLPGFYHTRAMPLLLLHGDLDAFVEYERNGRRAFERARPNARLMSVARGSHAAFAATVDPSLFPVIGTFVNAEGGSTQNPDSIGCAAVGGTLGMTGASFLAPLGGPERFVEPADGLLPCMGDEYKKPAMNPVEQQDIMVRTAVAFFDAHLGASPEKRQDGCRYVLHEVPKNAAVKLEE